MEAGPIFLTLSELVNIHKDQISRYGGTWGVRDLGLLQSAMAQPQARYAGNWLHDDLYLMAAAYAFHLCRNHPFIDGNKRTALAAALVFLELNGLTVHDPHQKLYQAVMSLAQGGLDKKGLAGLFEARSAA